jgi:hypothetical protein
MPCHRQTSSIFSALVRQRWQTLTVLFLCCVATGSQWDLVQIFAWGRMIADHSHTMSVSEAVTQTFGGEMCAICRMVANAKRQEQSRSDTPQGKIETKVLLYFEPHSNLIPAPRQAVAVWPSEAPSMTTDRSAPPLPPPRVACA